MDLKSIVNNDGAESKPQTQSPEMQRPAQPPVMGSTVPSHLPGQQLGHTRPDGMYQAPPRDGLARIHTGGQQQYPPAQSPASGQHRPYENNYPPVPNSRGSSYGPPQYPHHSPSQRPIGLPNQGSTHSISPTPSSHHTPTPQPIRQSPLAQHLQHPQYQHSQHLNSQPSTPLGPPPPFSRGANFESPIHQRSFSGASNPHSGSPAYYPGQIPSPQQVRRSSERERSISVSPKTIPRPTSIGSSRQSSQQEVYGSNRSSIQTMQAGPMAGSPSHVAQPYPPQFAPAPAPAPQVTHGVQQAIHPVPQPGVADSLSHQALPRPPLLSHQSSSAKMGMNNLLTPSSEYPPVANGAALPAAMASQSASAPRIPNESSMTNSRSQQPPPEQPQLKHEIDSAQDNSGDMAATEVKPSLKRSATEANGEPPLKQRKTTTRKYTERPPWARLSRRGQQQQQQPGQRSMPQTNGQPAPPSSIPDERPPWLHNPPLDMDLIGAREALGPWEKSMKWNTPYPDMLRVVQDWLWQNLEQLGDIGTNPQEGTVEIEAKIGYLIDNNTDQRLQLPVMTMCVVRPDPNRYSFRSEMQEHHHKHLNDYLNGVIKESLTPGRIGMIYEHPVHEDSFHHLSAYAKSLIPPAVQRYIHPKKEPRLRVTFDKKKKQYTDRIVKLKVADLHIFNPACQDCRISINVEVNFNRPDTDPQALIAPDDGSQQQPNEAPRRKDRLSYKHLAYQIDLTRIDTGGITRYELEEECDANKLRGHMAIAKNGGKSGFGDIVSGFLDNLVFLMRERAPGH